LSGRFPSARRKAGQSKRRFPNSSRLKPKSGYKSGLLPHIEQGFRQTFAPLSVTPTQQAQARNNFGSRATVAYLGMFALALMDLPQRYAYDPEWSLIASGISVGVGFVIFGGIGHWPWITLPFGVAFLVGGVALLRRRLFRPGFLELQLDALLLPTGFLQNRIVRIPYSAIAQAWERPGIPNLFLATPKRTFEVSAASLRDPSSYDVVRDFVKSRIQPKPKTISNHGTLNGGSAYRFECAYEGNGEIYDADDEILWRFRTQRPNARPITFVRVPAYGFFRLRDFILYDTAAKEVLRIKRERRLPRAKFVMFENGLPICTIRQRSLLLNKYTLDFVNGPKWTFHMPLFTAFFHGVSGTGGKVFARLWTHYVWLVLIEHGVESSRLAAALAFIHRERLRCS
jgi:hypothetical protein